MLPDSEKSAALEQVKRELRSILISEKHGVSLRNIQKDYEMLSCNRLPYKEFGFNDVQSFMHSIPDVARETGGATGEITYFAVCDATTSHIQKLVNNQRSKTKKKGSLLKRGRGGRGSRGGFRGGGGGRGNWRGASVPKPSSWLSGNPTTSTPVRPRPPQMMSGGGRWNRGGIPRASSSADPYSRQSGDWRNKGASSSGTGGFSTFTSNTDDDQGRPVRQWKESSSFLVRHNDDESTDDWDKENQSSSSSSFSSSFIHNLKIGVDSLGSRTIQKQDQTDLRERINNAKAARMMPADEEPKVDLRDVINAKKRDAAVESDENASSSSALSSLGQMGSRGRCVVRGEQESNLQGVGVPGRKATFNTRQTSNGKRYNKASASEIPPRFRKQIEGSSKPEGVKQEYDDDRISPVHHTETYDDTTVLYNIETKNWVTPENGSLYLEAFYGYFAKIGVPAPPIEVVSGKIAKQKGFYGRIKYEDKLYFPLEILHTEEEARQNAARSFYLQRGISLPQPEPTPPPPRLSPLTTPQAASSPSVLSEEVKKKVYDLIKEGGIFAKALPDQYKAVYGEEILPDFLPCLQLATHLFTVEEPFPGRFIIYKVPEAMVKLAQVAQMEDRKVEDSLPPLPDVGSVLKVMFSYAYSGDEVYVQKVEHEDLLYEIEELLQTLAEQSPPSSTDILSVSTLIAACYEDGWYRARVVETQQNKVLVSFIDYGNREHVIRENIRTLPDDKLVTATHPLTIPCCLQRPPGVEWRGDMTNFFQSLSETEPVLSAKVKAHKENLCEIELSLLSGESLIDKLTTTKPCQAVITTTTTTPSSPFPAATATVLSSPAPSTTFTSPTTAAAAALVSPEISSSSPTTSSRQKNTATPSVRLFAEDPNPLCLPESKMFGVYVCRVLTESSILLRIVDDEYSDKLDELECHIADHFMTWPTPKEVHVSNVYACVILPSDSEEEEDANKFYRVRVIRHNKKDGTYECCLLDHGDHEIVQKEQLREIDYTLNTSLAYQAILASLQGLDTLPASHHALAVEALIKMIVTDCNVFMATRKEGNDVAVDEGEKADPVVVNRVRKIISVMNDIDPPKVSKIYQDVYHTALDNVEEVIKQVPGHGFWKKSLEVELFDTSQDDDVSINQSIISILAEVERLQAEGKDGRTALHSFFGGSGSTSTDDAATADSKSVGDVEDNRVSVGQMNKLANDVGKGLTCAPHNNVFKQEVFTTSAMDRVCNYVQQQADSVAAVASASSSSSSLSTTGPPSRAGSLYTWSTNVNNVKDADWISSRPLTGNDVLHQQQQHHLPHPHNGGSINSGGGGDGSFPLLPPWYAFELNNFSALFILQAESPSDFVVIPYDMRLVLLQMEAEMDSYFSVQQKKTKVLSKDCLYAVNRQGVWHRTIYISSIEHLHHCVMYPDYHQFDTVTLEQLFPLPTEFYNVPFLGRKMALGAIAPNSQDWPESVKFWFIQNTHHKNMYGLIWDQQSASRNVNNVDSRLPKQLRAQLVDTSGEEDVIIDDVLCDKGWARHVQID